MSEITLEFDKKALKSLDNLMTHYRLNNRGDLISKALGMLNIAACIDKTGGQLLARKGDRETKIIIR
jgi:hypothetical protein